MDVPEARRQVLLVEPDDELGHFLVAVLTREGYSVVTTDYGGAVENEIGRCTSYSAIVVRLTPFPSPTDSAERAGVAFLKRLAEQEVRCLARTVALTTTRAAVGLDLYRVLPLPFELSEFVAAIHQCSSDRDSAPPGR